MSLQAYFNEFSEGHWADPDEKVCGCRGSGYALSDVDTWHKCPYHCTPTTRHPEDDYYDDDPVVNADSDELAITAEDMEAAELAVRAPVALTDDDIPF